MEAFVVIKLIFMVVVLVVSVLSYLAYYGRRRDSAKTLAAIRDRLSPARRLTPQEREILLPLLFDPYKHDKKALHLESDDVYILEGQFASHGLNTNGVATWHNTIAGVEVVLPFDAELFLQQENRAEVVFAGRYAFVLALNNTFTLYEGYERDLQQQKENEAWEAGERGALQERVVLQNLPEDAPSPASGSAADAVSILSQRDETPAEIEYRTGRGIAFLSGLYWVIGFIALAIATTYDLQLSRYVWMAVAALFISLGVWQFWRRWSLPSAQKINRVSAAFQHRVFMTQDGSNIAIEQFVLGDKLAFTIPEHWLDALDIKSGSHLEAELRVADYSAVYLSKRMSINEEVRRFPLVWWGRHLTLTLIGGIALLFAVSASPGVRADLMLGMHWLINTTPIVYDDPESLITDLPTAGDLISVNGEGRCQVLLSAAEWQSSSLNCQRLRWGGDVPVASNIAIDPAILTLNEGNFIKTRRDARLEMLIVLGGGSRSSNPPLVITNIAEVVAMVEKACSDIHHESTANTYAGSRFRDVPYHCQQVRNSLLSHIRLPDAKKAGDWTSMLGLLAEPEAEDNTQQIWMLQAAVTDLNRQGKRLAESIITQEKDILASDIIASQQGGVLLEIIDSSPVKAPYAGRKLPLELWQELVDLTIPEKTEPFQLTGLVVEQTSDSLGTATLVIDTARQLDQPWPATLRALWLLLAMMLMLIHGPLCVRNYLAKRARTQAIRQYYHKR